MFLIFDIHQAGLLNYSKLNSNVFNLSLTFTCLCVDALFALTHSTIAMSLCRLCLSPPLLTVAAGAATDWLFHHSHRGSAPAPDRSVSDLEYGRAHPPPGKWPLQHFLPTSRKWPSIIAYGRAI